MVGLQELTLHFPEPVNRALYVRKWGPDKDVLSVDFQGLLFLEGRIQYEGK
jgi:hypothetical protein